MELFIYNICKFGLYKRISEGEWECIVSECPPKESLKYCIFEAENDEEAKLFYEVGGYE